MLYKLLVSSLPVVLIIFILLLISGSLVIGIAYIAFVMALLTVEKQIIDAVDQ